jgi:hypothetical protein
LLPRDDVHIVPGASSETAFNQQIMKLEQRRYRHTRCTDRRHAGTGDRVQHPCGDRRDHAGHRLDVNNLSGDALFAAVPPDAPSVKRVPAVMNFSFLPDMGRMDGPLLSVARTGCSPAVTPAASAPLRFIRSCRPRN